VRSSLPFRTHPISLALDSVALRPGAYLDNFFPCSRLSVETRGAGSGASTSTHMISLSHTHTRSYLDDCLMFAAGVVERHLSAADAVAARVAKHVGSHRHQREPRRHLHRTHAPSPTVRAPRMGAALRALRFSLCI